MTPSEQARADALADAETLTLYFACCGFPALLLGKAGAILRVYGTNKGTLWRDVPEWARMDAHIAFRAVPGLRGE